MSFHDDVGREALADYYDDPPRNEAWDELTAEERAETQRARSKRRRVTDGNRARVSRHFRTPVTLEDFEPRGGTDEGAPF